MIIIRVLAMVIRHQNYVNVLKDIYGFKSIISYRSHWVVQRWNVCYV